MISNLGSYYSYYGWNASLYDNRNKNVQLELISAPTGSVVTLQETKNFLREDRTVEDNLIQSLIDAATSTVIEQTGYAFLNTKFKLHLQRFTDVRIPVKPFQTGSISIDYTNKNGADLVLSSSKYTVYDYETPPKVDFYRDLPEYASPEIMQNYEKNEYPIRISFTAGYGTNSTDVPENWKTAIKIICMYYQRREYQNVNILELPVINALIGGKKVGRFK